MFVERTCTVHVVLQLCILTGTPQKLDEIDQDLEDFKYTVKTQAVTELMNYQGINDWGEVR